MPWSIRGLRDALCSLHDKVGRRGFKVGGPVGSVTSEPEDGNMDPVLVGIDVSAASFDVALQLPGRMPDLRKFDNTPAGRTRFLSWLSDRSKGRRARVCLESTGVYSLDLCVLLDRLEAVEV